MKKIQKWFSLKRVWVIAILILIYMITIGYHQWKSIPDGIDFKGEARTLAEGEIDFLYDLTYQRNGKEFHEQEIFNEVYRTIEQAEEFLIMDFFMMNETSSSSRDFPDISETISEKIVAQKEQYPDLEVIFITDPVNTTYGSHNAEHIAPLEDIGAEVIYTNLNRLRDPNPLYSGIWRMFFQWFGQEGTGWITNPFGAESPDVTARSYLKLLNIKANHRKIVISENNGLVISANPHDASGFHSNVGFKVKGDIIKDLVESEKAVAAFSGGDTSLFPTDKQLDSWIDTGEEEKEATATAQIVTEKEIQRAAISAIDGAKQNEQIWIGMFYIADRSIIDAIKEAADRGVSIHLVLDPNQNAFGNEKVGLPNIPIASELHEHNSEQITVKWYNIRKEQYHTKMLYVRQATSSKILAGSGNFTSRNLNNYNLESDILITSPNKNQVVEEVDAYFHRIWKNEDAEYTLPYEDYKDSLSFIRKGGYILQKLTMFTTY